MQIVIELPDKVLARIRSRHGHCGSPKYGNGIWTDDLLTVSTAIYFGKILPKGHGRLIDADALRTSFRESIDEYRKLANEVGNDTMMYARISQAVGTFVEASLRTEAQPTLVEADKEDTE